MNKLLLVLIAAGVVAVVVMSWRFSSSQVAYQLQPSPVPATLIPLEVPPQADTYEMMRLLQDTVDDGGKADLETLDQEVSQL